MVIQRLMKREIKFESVHLIRSGKLIRLHCCVCLFTARTLDDIRQRFVTLLFVVCVTAFHMNSFCQGGTVSLPAVVYVQILWYKPSRAKAAGVGRGGGGVHPGERIRVKVSDLLAVRPHRDAFITSPSTESRPQRTHSPTCTTCQTLCSDVASI